MTILAVLIQTLAFYCMYNTSQRAQLRKDRWSVWLHSHSRVSIIAGLLLLVLSFLLMVTGLGFGAGVLAAFLSFMTLGSLIIVSVPLTTKNS